MTATFPARFTHIIPAQATPTMTADRGDSHGCREDVNDACNRSLDGATSWPASLDRPPVLLQLRQRSCRQGARRAHARKSSFPSSCRAHSTGSAGVPPGPGSPASSLAGLIYYHGKVSLRRPPTRRITLALAGHRAGRSSSSASSSTTLIMKSMKNMPWPARSCSCVLVAGVWFLLARGRLFSGRSLVHSCRPDPRHDHGRERLDGHLAVRRRRSSPPPRKARLADAAPSSPRPASALATTRSCPCRWSSPWSATTSATMYGNVNEVAGIRIRDLCLLGVFVLGFAIRPLDVRQSANASAP